MGICSLGVLGGFSGAALAGSVTAESIWSQQNAEERARSQMPAGSVLLNRSCETLEVRNDLRYRCTLITAPPLGRKPCQAPLPKPSENERYRTQTKYIQLNGTFTYWQPLLNQ